MNTTDNLLPRIERLKSKVQILHGDESSGHDWWHVYRVYKTAKNLACKENADLELVSAAALVHDIGDYKLTADGIERYRELIPPVLQECGYNEGFISRVLKIIENVSFKGTEQVEKEIDIETACVQDADRLDALGAIGIARAFAYGGKKGRSIYIPNEKPREYSNFEEYRNNTSHTINHFYEKLLLLKKIMNTRSGRAEAEKRHAVMVDYLKNFYREWEGGEL